MCSVSPQTIVVCIINTAHQLFEMFYSLGRSLTEWNTFVSRFSATPHQNLKSSLLWLCIFSQLLLIQFLCVLKHCWNEPSCAAQSDQWSRSSPRRSVSLGKCQNAFQDHCSEISEQKWKQAFNECVTAWEFLNRMYSKHFANDSKIFYHLVGQLASLSSLPSVCVCVCLRNVCVRVFVCIFLKSQKW